MFTKEQIEYLKTTTKSYTELSKEFNVTPDQIRYFYKKNSITKLTNSKSINDLTDEQINKFKEEFQNRSIESFVDEFSSSQHVLINLAKKLNLVKDKRIITYKQENSWSDQEINFLKENYSILSIDELSEKLNRSTKAIVCKMHRLKLPYAQSDTVWSEHEINFLKENYTNGLETISYFLERPLKGVRHKANQLKLDVPTQRETSIETQMKSILDKLSVEYRYDTKFSTDYNYRPDFLINNKIIIECFGDYWHANPVFYDSDHLTSAQLATKHKDEYKKNLYTSLGYDYNIIWEYEFENQSSLVEKIKNILNIKTA